MRKLDFISEGPQLAIFQEDANKNNLGGVLYLIHILILIILAVIYIADFIDDDKYKFNYIYIRDTFNETELKQGISADKENLNFDLEFKYQIGKDNDSYILPKDSRFTLVFFDNETYESMENDIIHANTRNFRVGVAIIVVVFLNVLFKKKIELKVAHIF